MTNEPSARLLRLPFKRPEYFSVPELLISSLAHRAHHRLADSPPIGHGPDTIRPTKSVGYMYRADPRQTSALEVRTTFPQHAELTALGDELKRRGLESDGPGSMLAEAVARSVLGIRLDKTGFQPASPLTPALALLQDPRGVLVKAGPPDFADILESMFAVGASDDGQDSVTARWMSAADRRLEVDPILRGIDASIDVAVLHSAYERRDDLLGLGHEEARVWAGQFSGTPYSWFNRAWAKLTSDAWVDALPARVWVDWATTVLRLTMGLGFLWEASWYENLARAVIDRAVPSTFRELASGVDEPLPWRSRRAAIGTRDVASHIKHRISRGEKARNNLIEWIDEYEKDGHDLSRMTATEFLRRVADEARPREVLSRGMNSSVVAGKTVHETVKYGLQARQSSGEFADYYGILRSHGRRWVLVDPGTEWISVVASLTCPGPSESCTVGDVLTDLTALGMRPEIRDLVELLERAGLARGSADADNAVVVESAF
ncbi:hypothetical protein [Sinomonas flava]|uniref:hypothetical protein n=1 Tax=Sinomonas flava TaxID=496857 RepID=UPI0039A7817A